MRNLSEESRKKISESLKRAHAEGRMDTSFGGRQAWMKGLTKKTDSRIQARGVCRFDEEQVFTKNSEFSRKQILNYIKVNEVDISECGHSEWLGEKLVRELHHKDGDETNNEKENLEFLCPNCHSITKNYKFKGRIPWNKKAL